MTWGEDRVHCHILDLSCVACGRENPWLLLLIYLEMEFRKELISLDQKGLVKMCPTYIDIKKG